MEDIKLYDFKKSEKFSIENIRNLALMCEEFCKTSNMQINYETKNESFKMIINSCAQTTYGEFVEAIKGDSVVIEYSILPVVENLTLFIDKVVVLSIVDLLLGGNGKVQMIDREPTNIDLELLKYLFENLLKRIYIPHSYEKIDISKIHTNKVQYQNLTNNDMIFNSQINIYLENEIIGCMRICIPYENMKEVVDSFENVKMMDYESTESEKRNDIISNEIFQFVKDVEVDICANLGSAKVSIRDLLNLEVGDVILLDQRINDDIIVSVGDAKTYKAKPGVLGIQKGVEITDIINREI